MNIKKKETRAFQSEVKQLLQLMIHSLYSNKEIFLRELISNAADAIDKLRFISLSNTNLYKKDLKLRARLSYNKKNRTITITDNGIGMRRDEVIENLGTIAKSGTKSFIKSIKLNNLKDNKFIGKFGVGFYSSFIVASKVTVYTLYAGSKPDEGVFWESTGDGNYTIANIMKSEQGTEITLHLREGEDEFLDDWRIKNIITKYSDHISLPIELAKYTTSDKKNNIENTIVWEKINKATALWTRNKSDISDEEYKEFYKYLSHDVDNPLVWSHNQVEGKQEYISLLYIPSKTPWDIFNRDHKHGIKLYIQRVFIMDNVEQFVPRYLRFVKGLIDSSSLPLNISREVLQDSYITQNLKKSITKRVLNILENLSKNNKEKYQLFWKQFGIILKEGLGEDPSNNKTIARLLRFSSTYANNSIQNVSLEEYISRMGKEQKKIYYITTDSYSAAQNNPHLEIFLKKGIEVILFSDRIDEWMISYLKEFDGKMFQSISKSDPSLDELAEKENKSKKQNEQKFKPFIDRIKKYLGTRIKDVKLTNRLTNTPTIVTTANEDITTQMGKLFAATGQDAPKIKYIFEINPNHSIIQHITNIENDIEFNEWIELLLDQALLVECGTLENPNLFIRRINNLFNTKYLKTNKN